MKLQFSLATLLVCVTVLAVVCAAAVRLPVYETLSTNRRVPADINGIPIENSGSGDIFSWVIADSHPPTAQSIVRRLALWGPSALAVTFYAFWLIRRLKSRRENGPPVG
jgi:hypothetical protein